MRVTNKNVLDTSGCDPLMVCDISGCTVNSWTRWSLRVTSNSGYSVTAAQDVLKFRDRGDSTRGATTECGECGRIGGKDSAEGNLS